MVESKELNKKVKKGIEKAKKDPKYQLALKYIEKMEESFSITKEANKKIKSKKTKYTILS